MQSLKELTKKLVFRYTALGAPKYPYGLEPIQLAEVINGIERAWATGTSGAVVEIGVARGMTSRFIAEHIRQRGVATTFYCIDTFSSFTADDLNYEIHHRNKKKSELVGFSYNDFEIWKKNFADFEFVKPLQADAGKFDFEKIGPVACCLLDVDLYVPTKAVLENIQPHMIEGGTIIVDDVRNNNKWDGAYQAFFEHVAAHDVRHRTVGNRCGIIEF